MCAITLRNRRPFSRGKNFFQSFTVSLLLLHMHTYTVLRMTPSLVVGSLAYSQLPTSYHTTANNLKTRLEWLVSDELVSAACEATPITTPLLQTVAAHVQATHRMSNSCFVIHVPLRFVFGANQSKGYFLDQLETMDMPAMYSLIMIDDYCYIKPKKIVHPQVDSSSDIRGSVADLFNVQSSVEFQDTSEREQLHVLATSSHFQESIDRECQDVQASASQFQDREGDRSKTPPPIPVVPQSRYHRRSLSSGFPRGHVPVRYTPTLEVPSQPASSVSSQISLDKPSNNDGYEASDSSISSMSEASGNAKAKEEIANEMKGFWLVLRILPQKVELYFQLQSSRQGTEKLLPKLKQLCEQVEISIVKTCHQTNQWFLLRDMLETRKCSPYLMSESASEAWVNTVVKQEDKHRQLLFDPEEFRCEQMWKTHITPHWRLKTMKSK